MKPGSRSTIRTAACWRMRSTARSRCTPSTAAWCRNWPRAITSGSCCRWCGRCCARRGWSPRISTAWPTPRGRACSGRCWSGLPGPLAGLRLGCSGTRGAPYGGASAGADAGSRAAAIPVRGPAGLGRPHAAGAGGRHRHATGFSANRSMMRRARPSTRSPRCSVSTIPAAPTSRGWPSRDAPGIFRFPRPMINRPGLDFSFSGLKTACATAIRALRAADGSIEPQDARRRGLGISAGRGRYPGDQVPARAGARPASGGW